MTAPHSAGPLGDKATNLGIGLLIAAAILAGILRAAGTAARADVARTASRKALLRRAGHLRPCLDMPDPEDVGYRIGASHGIGVWASVEDSILLIGPPRSGKGAHIAINMILDAPGAVVTTSTRPDNLTATLRARQRVGPIAVFDPQHLAEGVPAGVRWSPIRGCEDPLTAMIRAASLAAATGLSAEGVEGGGCWERQAETWAKRTRDIVVRADAYRRGLPGHTRPEGPSSDPEVGPVHLEDMHSYSVPPTETKASAPRRRCKPADDHPLPTTIPIVAAEADQRGGPIPRVDGVRFRPEPIARAAFSSLLDEAVRKRGTTLRVQGRESDGASYTDLLAPPVRIEPDPVHAAPQAEDLAAAEATALLEVTGARFVLGEKVALAPILAHAPTRGDGTVRSLVKFDGSVAELLVYGRVSGTSSVVRVGS